ncbi:putative isomerase YraM [Betaproteobacteria bacterium]|nr:putative isomerase YraM [Betaproteobacteria bacterium]
MKKVPYVLMRGGTSKAVFFHEKDMPPRKNWDAFLLDVMGSPDANQIDGMGGANSLTSKVAIISPSNVPGYAVDYTFAQVSLAEASVHYKGNCGNISSAVAPFALDEGLVPGDAPSATVRFRNTNTDKILESAIAVADGMFDPEGDCAIPGVPSTGSAIRMFFMNPEGAVTGKLLPTGNAVDVVETKRGPVRISIVDAANPLVFFTAEEAGFTGKELPDEFSAEDLAHLEDIRSAAAELCGFASRAEATAISPGVPKTTMISPPQDYTTINGDNVRAVDMDLCIRMMSMQKPHKAMALTGAICTAVAAMTKGTLVAETLPAPIDGILRIGHPGGVMSIPVEKDADGSIKAGALRTARRLADGFVYTRQDHYSGVQNKTSKPDT